MNFMTSALPWLEKVSPKLASQIAFRLFCQARTAPLRLTEQGVMKSAKKMIFKLNGYNVMAYHWGDKGKRVLLVHGWEARASRFYAWIEILLNNGYQVIAFDAPAHGESEGFTTNIIESKDIMFMLQEKFERFHAVISHSLGTLNAFYALKHGIEAESIVSVAGVSDFNYLPRKFLSQLKLGNKTEYYLRKRLENKFNFIDDIWSTFSAHLHPEKIKSRVYIIHDEEDNWVDANQSMMLNKSYGNGNNLYFTKLLGHHRILTDQAVINRIIDYIN